jgi:RecB family exonuclease
MRSLERALQRIPDLQIRDQALKELLHMEDVEAGRVSPLAEVLSAIRNGDPIKEGIREHMRRKHKTPLQTEVKRLQARVKQLVDEALAEASMNPAELRQAVIRKLALDLDTEADPSMDEIQAEVREVRLARAKRKRH